MRVRKVYGLDMTEEISTDKPAGFTGISVTFTHPVADGLHAAIVKATRPAGAAAR